MNEILVHSMFGSYNFTYLNQVLSQPYLLQDKETQPIHVFSITEML